MVNMPRDHGADVMQLGSTGHFLDAKNLTRIVENIHN
jgi:hypothetical protein